MATDFNDVTKSILNSEQKLTLSTGQVSRFCYTQEAFDSDTVAGTDNYNYNQEQNIPLGTETVLQMSNQIINKGLRSQASSLTRMGVNHFFGRSSYNINKLSVHLKNLLTNLITFFREGDNAWSETAEYLENDVVYFLCLLNGNPCKRTFQAKKASQNKPPVDTTTNALINVDCWREITSNFADTTTHALTVNGTLTVNGDILQEGSTYETHAEEIYSKDDKIIVRDGAISAIPSGDLAGIRVKNYDGHGSDSVLSIDNTGTAFVGDIGDTQPVATREVESNMRDGYGVSWNATKKCLETTFIPSGAVIPTEIQGDTSVTSVVAERAFYITSLTSCTFTLGNGAQIGIKVRIINTTSLTHTLSCASVSVNVPKILPMANVEIMWNGTAWQNISGEAVGSTWVQRSQQESPFDVFPCSAWTELANRNGAFERSENAPVSIYTLDGVTFYADVERERPIDINGLGTATDTGNTEYNSRGEQMKIYSGSWTSGNADAYIDKTGVLTAQMDALQEHTHTLQNAVISTSGVGNAVGGLSTPGVNAKNAETNTGTTGRFDVETRPINFTVRIWKRTA